MMWQMGAKNDRTATLDGKEGKSEEEKGRKGERVRGKGVGVRRVGAICRVRTFASCFSSTGTSTSACDISGPKRSPKIGRKTDLGWECSR